MKQSLQKRQNKLRCYSFIEKNILAINSVEKIKAENLFPRKILKLKEKFQNNLPKVNKT